MELFSKAMQGVQIIAVPFRRNFPHQAVENPLVNALSQAFEPRLKRFPAGHSFVYAIAGVEATQRRIGKIPLARIETKPLVNHECAVAPLVRATLLIAFADK